MCPNAPCFRVAEVEATGIAGADKLEWCGCEVMGVTHRRDASVIAEHMSESGTPTGEAAGRIVTAASVSDTGAEAGAVGAM